MEERDDCGHEHRTAKAAHGCLRWYRPIPDWAGARELVSQHGLVIAVGADGAERVAEEHRPPRFVEHVLTHGRVRATWRLWLHEHPKEGYPVEIEFRCGDWTQEWMATRGFSAAAVEGWAEGLWIVLDTMGPDALVAMWHAAQRGQPETPNRGVVVRGPWSAPEGTE